MIGTELELLQIDTITEHAILLSMPGDGDDFEDDDEEGWTEIDDEDFEDRAADDEDLYRIKVDNDILDTDDDDHLPEED